MRLLKRGLEHQALTQANQSTRLAGQMLEIGVNAWHPQADNMQVHAVVGAATVMQCGLRARLLTSIECQGEQ